MITTDWTSNDPTWGWQRLNFERVRWLPNLEYDPQLEKFINDIIIYEAVEFFDVQSFGVQIRCLVFRRSVPFGVGSFGIRSFDVGSLFGIGSNSTLSHSVFGHSVFGLSAFGHSKFGHSVFSLSAFSRWIENLAALKWLCHQFKIGSKGVSLNRPWLSHQAQAVYKFIIFPFYFLLLQFLIAV